MASGVTPWVNRLRTSSTETLISRMMGLPPKTSGREVMRDNSLVCVMLGFSSQSSLYIRLRGHRLRQVFQQTATLAPDPGQRNCPRSRHDRTALYGCDDIGKVLEDVNINLVFVLFPVSLWRKDGELLNSPWQKSGIQRQTSDLK